MPREIFPSSYECDCGHQSDFGENTIREAKEKSWRKPLFLCDSEKNEHTIVFRDGKMTGILCPNAPKDRSEPPRSLESTLRSLTVPRGKDSPSTQAGKKPRFTPTQGQYLAFIHLYTKLHRCPPAETDLLMYFRTTPPSIHQMIVTLEKRGLIEKVPGRARTIRILVPVEELPELE